jgi:hypothetical protein
MADCTTTTATAMLLSLHMVPAMHSCNTSLSQQQQQQHTCHACAETYDSIYHCCWQYHRLRHHPPTQHSMLSSGRAFVFCLPVLRRPHPSAVRSHPAAQQATTTQHSRGTPSTPPHSTIPPSADPPPLPAAAAAALDGPPPAAHQQQRHKLACWTLSWCPAHDCVCCCCC